MLKTIEHLGCTTGAKLLGVNKSIIIRWRKELNILGEDGLIAGKGIQSKGIQSKGIHKKGRPKNIDFKMMTKEELINYRRVN